MFLSAQPTWAIKFEGAGRSTARSIFSRVLNQWKPQRLSLRTPALVGGVHEETVQLGGDFRELPYEVTARGQLREMRGGRGRRFRSVTFHVTNFPDFIGSRITDGAGWWTGRLELTAGSWRIILDARRSLSKLQSELREQGGYAVTHIGSLDQGGGAFALDEAEDCLAGLHWFLSFVRGMWTSPILMQGRSLRGRHTLSVWSEGRTDPWGGAFRWCDPTGWKAAQEAYAGYAALWVDPVWQQGLRVAIGLYISANKPSPLENAIIAAQSGLELLGWLQLVEGRRVAAPVWTDPRQYPAHRKMRELLGLANVDPAIPARLTKLPGLNQAWRDGPDVVAGVRNQLVHPTRARGRVGWQPEVLFETWLLASWYLELGLLHAMDVRNAVRNRLDPNVATGRVEKPPGCHRSAHGRTPANMPTRGPGPGALTHEAFAHAMALQ